MTSSSRSSAPDRAEYTALSERMGNLLILRFAMAVIVIAWAALRPEAVGIEFEALLAGTVGYLALSTVVEILRRRTDRFGHGLLTGLLLRRRPVSRLRDVRHRRDAEPDPLPGLPRPGGRVAAGVVSDRAQDRAVGLAAAVRDALCAGREPRPAGRGRRRRGHRIRSDAGPQCHLVLAVRDRDVGVLGAQRARAAPAPRRICSRWSRSVAGSTTRAIRSSRRGSCWPAWSSASTSSAASSSAPPTAG